MVKNILLSIVFKRRIMENNFILFTTSETGEKKLVGVTPSYGTMV